MTGFLRRRLYPFLLLVALAAHLLLFPGIACPFPNEPGGYRGMSWGTPIENIPHMVFLGPHPEKEGTALYGRPDDILRFGKAALKSVHYEFVGGRFSAVVIKVADLFNYVQLKEEVLRQFGEGRDLDRNAERFFWDGKRTRITLVSAFDLS